MKAFPGIILRLRNNLPRALFPLPGQAQQLFIAMVLRYEFYRIQTYILDPEWQDLIICGSIGCQNPDKQRARHSTRHTRYNQQMLKIESIERWAIMGGRTMPVSIMITMSTFGLRDKQALHAG